MRKLHKSFFVSVRNRSPYGKMSVCDALAKSYGEWGNFVTVHNIRHAFRIVNAMQKKWRHIDVVEFKNGRVSSRCVMDMGRMFSSPSK